eukprot:4951712-Pleurochrysis_carterae.AAC.3
MHSTRLMSSTGPGSHPADSQQTPSQRFPRCSLSAWRRRQAYYLVSSADPDVLFGRLVKLPAHVLAAPRMQRALRVVAAIQSNDFASFFRELKQARSTRTALFATHGHRKGKRTHAHGRANARTRTTACA